VNKKRPPELLPEKRLGLAVRARRMELGWSQETLSFESGLHRTYIGAVERGEKNVTIRNLIRIANALGTRCSQFLLNADL